MPSVRVLALALVSFCAASAVQLQPAAAGDCSLVGQLNGDRIAGELGGHELKGFSVVTDARWTERLHPGGVTEFRNARGEATHGRWRVAGDRLCFSYGTMTEWTCKTVHRVAPACEGFRLALVDETGRIASGVFSATPLGYGGAQSAGPASSAALDAAMARERSWNLSVRRGVQNALIWTGDYNGVLDGDFGPRTRAAIRSFQGRIGAPATGFLAEEEIERLQSARMAAVEAAGFRIVDDYETGIRVGLPEALLRRSGRDDIFVEYQHRPGAPAARLRLLSSFAVRDELEVFFDAVRSEGDFGADPYAVLRDDWFVVSGTEQGVTGYIHVRFDAGALKGFFLQWPASESATFGPIATAMYNSFESFPGIALSPSTVPAHSGDGAARDTDGAPKQPAPQAELVGTGSGFVVDASGQVLTNAHVVEECSAIEVADGVPAVIAGIDRAADLALLQTRGGYWPAAAGFSARPARLNSDVTVVGYPLHDLLGSLNVTRGAVSAISGPGNDASVFQFTAAVQPGNSGGPVLDEQGAVVGVVQSKLNAVRVAAATGDIPQNVNFAIRAEVAKLFLARHHVEVRIIGTREALEPADLADEAQAFTVLIRCF